MIAIVSLYFLPWLILFIKLLPFLGGVMGSTVSLAQPTTKPEIANLLQLEDWGMKVWADAVTITAAGATAGSQTDASQITLRAGARYLLAIQYLLVGAIPTSGQNGIPIIIIKSDSLGIQNQRWFASVAKTDGIATNDKEAPVYCGRILLAYGGDDRILDFADITISVDSNVDITGGWEGAVGVVYSNMKPTPEFRQELISWRMGPNRGGKTAEDDAGVTAAGKNPFATGISIPAGFVQLRGLLGYVNPNAPTAGEATSGFAEHSSDDIPDFAPQKWVFNVGWDASLGTPVGTPVSASGFDYHPTRFPLTGQKTTIDVQTTLAVALSNGGDAVAGAGIV